MERLTEDDIIDCLANSIVDLHGSELLTKITEMANDLLEYKKLEEELGCPLEVYIKATSEGIWYSIAGNMKHCFVDVIKASKIVFAMKGTNIWYELKNYQKTWWLKEDRSE